MKAKKNNIIERRNQAMLTSAVNFARLGDSESLIFLKMKQSYRIPEEQMRRIIREAISIASNPQKNKEYYGW